MFRPGTRYRFDEDVGGGQAVVEVHEVGLLHLATGRLVAGDPFWVDTQAPAFTVTVPPGDYPVDVSMARTERRRADPGYPGPAPLGAAARLTIRQKRATTWEMALLPGEDIADLGPGEFYGMPVDTGTAAFLDASAVARWSRRLNRQAWEEDPESAEIDSAIARSEPINVVVDRSTDLNLVIFSCGMGDGSYPVWIGRTSSGEPAAYIADLELLSRHASVITH
jgi:hypothetical protein